MRRLIAIVALLIVSVPLTAMGQSDPSSWALAMQSDQVILDAIEILPKEGRFEGPAVFLLREYGFDVGPGSHQRYQTMVFQVNDPALLNTLTLAPYLGPRGTIEAAQAFVVRAGSVRKLTEGSGLSIKPGDGRVRMHQLVLEPGELQSGDVVGWSSVVLVDRIVYNEVLPAVARVPVLLASLRIRDAGRHNYRIAGWQLDGLQMKAEQEQNGRPTHWHATARNLPAMPSLVPAFPYSPEMPLWLVAEAEEFGTMGSQEWIPTLAWSRVALWLSGIREMALAKMLGATAKSAEHFAASGGSPLDREREVFEYVRDEIANLEGAGIEAIGFREPADIAATKSAVELEKAMIMLALLQGAGLGGELAAVRPQAWGPLDDDLQSFVQFRHFIVRCGDEEPRYYAPSVPGAIAGELPEAWGNAMILSPKPGLTQKAYEIAADMTMGPQGDLRSEFTKVQTQAVEQGWVRLEHAK